MSYCRFGEGDVYLYHSSGGGFVCCECSLDSKSRWKRFPSRRRALAHLLRHKAVGQRVPARALSRLKAEMRRTSTLARGKP